MNFRWLSVALGLVCIGLCLPISTLAQQQQDDKQEYISVRIDFWSKRLRRVETDGSGLRLKLALSTALFRYRTLDDLLDPDTEHINALGLRLKSEFEYPTGMRNIAFVPDLELALNRSLDTSNRLLSAAATGAFLYRHNGDPNHIRVKAGIKYGTRYEMDGLNFDDYVELSLRINLKRLHWFKTGQRRLTVTPFGEIKHFADNLEFETASGSIFDVDRQYELGLEFSTDPRKKLWGIPLPKVGLSYVFGDDFKGVKLRL